MGDGVGFSVLVTTTGRETLGAALASVAREWDAARDEVVVLHDGVATSATRALWEASGLVGEGLAGRWIELEEGPHGDWGHTPRNRGLSVCGREWVVHLDDDDALAMGALDVLRRAVLRQEAARGPRLLVPRMVKANGERVWTKPEFVEGQVGTGNLVHPTGLARGEFAARYGGDFEFARSLRERNAGLEVEFLPEVTYLVRPEETVGRETFRDLSGLDGEWGREDFQGGWQMRLARCLPGGSWLDVGSGLGGSRARLEAAGHTVTLQDVGPGLPVDVREPIERLPTGGWEVVSAFDVVEHVVEDGAFLRELVRVARRAVVMTTPNVWVSRCRNPHHVREYSPPGLAWRIQTLEGVRRCRWFAGDARGKRVVEVEASAWGKEERAALGVVVEVG